MVGTKPKGKGLTVESYLARYCRTTNERTLANYRRILGGAEAFIGKPLAGATAKDLERLKVESLAPMKSGYVMANYLRSFFKRAGRPEVADILHLKKEEHRLDRSELLTPSEVQKLIEACTSQRDRALLGVLWDCGVRVHEALALRLQDVRERPANGGPRAYVLWFGKTKIAGEEHEGLVLETAEVMAEWLANYPFTPDDAAPLFPSFSGRFMTSVDGWRIVQKAAKRAKLAKAVRPHLFRHSRATFLLARGLTEAKVKRLLGWSAASGMLGKYAHLIGEDAFDDVLRINGHVVPKATEYEHLSIDKANLKPVRPVVARPGAPVPTERVAKAFADLLANADEDTRRKLLEVLSA